MAMADEEGDVFWDAVEAMDEDGLVNHSIPVLCFG